MTPAEGSAHSRYPVNGPDCWGLSDDGDDEDEHTRKPRPGQASTALTQPRAPRPPCPTHPPTGAGFAASQTAWAEQLPHLVMGLPTRTFHLVRLWHKAPGLGPRLGRGRPADGLVSLALELCLPDLQPRTSEQLGRGQPVRAGDQLLCRAGRGRAGGSPAGSGQLGHKRHPQVSHSVPTGQGAPAR